jgi:RNA polymerase-binding transcription factor DksA
MSAVTPDAQTIDYRSLLELERRQLQAELSELGFGEAGEGVGLDYDPNFADSSQVTAERGEAGVLAGQLRETLEEVALALGRIEDGTYGRCEVCGVDINSARLEAMPATRFCINHASRP